jgi:hypothetical protein
MKSFKILIIAMLLLAAWNGYAQNTSAGTQKEGSLPTTINQEQEEYDPVIIPESQRSTVSDKKSVGPNQDGMKEIAEDEDSPAVIRNKDSRYTPASATNTSEPNSTDPASPDYNPAIISPEKVTPKKSEL